MSTQVFNFVSQRSPQNEVVLLVTDSGQFDLLRRIRQDNTDGTVMVSIILNKACSD